MQNDEALATVRVDHRNLEEFVASALERIGVSRPDAEIVAECLVDADLRGIPSHGMARFPTYIGALKRGFNQAKPLIHVQRTSQGTAVIDGGGGLGSLIAVRGMREAVELARENGIGMVAVRNSNHFGHAGYYAGLAAANGCIGIVFSNASPTVAPFGGCQAILGTNPMAVAAPGGDRPNFVLDISAAVISRGWLRLAALENKPIPEGLAVTKEGTPARTPQEAIAGVLLPFAQHKGSGLAMMVDLLAGVLSGAGFGTGVQNMVVPCEGRGDVGHALIAIRISAFLDPTEYEARYRLWYDTLKASSPAQGSQGVMIPGERSAALAWEQRRNGIEIRAETWQSLQQLAADLDLHLEQGRQLHDARCVDEKSSGNSPVSSDGRSDL